MTLEQLTGQDTIICSISEHLTEGKIVTVNLKGSSGTGKSWLLNDLSSVLSKKEGCIIKLKGDFVRKAESYYPLNTFIEQNNRITKRGVKAVKELIGEIPIIGSPTKSFLEDVDLQSFHKRDQEIDDFQLFKHRQFATHILSLVSRHKILAILCDDIQDFDSETIIYLNNLIKYLNSKKFIAEILFVFAYNTDKNDNLESINWLSFSHYEYLINTISREQLISALRLLGLNQELQESDLNLIYSATGGHLQILKYVIDYLNKNEFNNIISGSGKNLVFNILNARLHQFQQYYLIIKELLGALSRIGKAGSKMELLCVLEDNNEVAEAMKYAEQLDFITIKDGYISFSNDIVKEYISSVDAKKSPTFYRKFSNCLRNLNPSNYLRRAWTEERIGDLETSDVFHALFVIQRIRLGMYDEVFKLNKLFVSSEAANLVDVLDIFLISYQNNANGLLDEALLSISQLPSHLPQKLLAERVYLECEILLKQIDYGSRKEALNKLESWEFLKDDEPEQWYRFVQLKLLANAELGNYELATKIEQEIFIYFSNRIRFDINAQAILNRLNLFSEIIYSPEIAHVKLTQTCQLLKKEIEAENFDKLLDYYISLCNLSGNSIANNKMEVALSQAQKAIILIKQFPFVHFPHNEIAINNLLLASHFLQAETADIIKNKFCELANQNLQEDGILINVNYAGILVQQNMIIEAFTVLENIDYLIDMVNTDPFYLYYHKFNYALVSYLIGKKEEAIVIFKELANFEKRISNKLNPYYKKHYDITFELILQNTSLNYTQMRKLFIDKQPRYLGISWEKFKSIYLFTDLQIWTNN